VVRVGAKSANLGEVVHALAAGTARGFRVPPGFAIPFAYFDRFRRKNGLDQAVEAFLKDPRREQLAVLRDRFLAAPIDPDDAKKLLARRRALLGDQGVFVRSSTNAEDLPGFSGAGLYTTVPNVRSDEAFLAAVKAVWASVWNDAAYDAREREGVDHRAVMAGVLVQQGMDAEAAGVLLTANPFDTADRDVVYLNAKRGLGLRVVEGRKVPEQLLFDVRKRTVRVLARSGDDAMLSFAPDGGVREVKIEPGRQVLTDAVVFQLADAAVQLRAVFGGRPQDIEWVVANGAVLMVQARPYAAAGEP
jgi:rifampicin phosphotransferase